jgi:hypothetical protein
MVKLYINNNKYNSIMHKCDICMEKYECHSINHLLKCNDKYSNRNNKLLHYFTKIYIEEINNIKNYKNCEEKKYYNCELCNKIIINKQNYESHIKNKICQRKKKEFKCTTCEKIFKEKRSLIYHNQKNVCSNKNNITNKNNIINKINNTNNNVNNIQNNTININVGNISDIEKVIEMLPFKNVKYNITPQKYLEYAKYPERAIKSFVKDEHFNSKKPERMNILNSNSRSNKMQILDHDDNDEIRWLLKSKKDVCDLLYDRGINHLYVAKNILNSNGIFLDTKTEKRLNEKINEYETDNKSRKEQIDIISDLTYNYRDVVQNNQKNTKLLIK